MCINPGKTVYLANLPRLRTPLTIAGVEVSLRREAKYLGTPITYEIGVTPLFQEMWDLKWSKAVMRLVAIRSLPAPQGTKTKLVGAASQSVLKYALYCFQG